MTLDLNPHRSALLAGTLVMVLLACRALGQANAPEQKGCSKSRAAANVMIGTLA